jgi:hypothetical protein
MTNKCSCGNEKEDWQAICRVCYAQLKQKPENGPNKTVTREQDIRRQVFTKIASEQVKGSPRDIVEYARRLEAAYNSWS